MSKICIINGHPDPHITHLDHGLARAYLEGAQSVGHEVKMVDIAQLDFPLIHNKQQFESGDIPPDITWAQETIRTADHIVLVYPLWLGTMPALFKGFLEQVFRPGFAVEFRPGKFPRKLLKGRSVRIIMTMGMPALAYRVMYRGYSLKALKVGILKFSGLGPVRTTLIGGVEQDAFDTDAWLARVRQLGEDGR